METGVPTMQALHATFPVLVPEASTCSPTHNLVQVSSRGDLPRRGVECDVVGTAQ